MKWSYGLLPSGLGVHTIPVPMELKTLVGPAPVGAPTGAKVIFFCLRRANKVMLRLGVAIDNSTIGMPIHGYRLESHVDRGHISDFSRRNQTAWLAQSI